MKKSKKAVVPDTVPVETVTTLEDTSAVSVSSEVQKLVNPNPVSWKTVKIEMMDDLPPSIEFDGFWRGKDIALVLNTLKRQYPLYIRGLRRSNMFQKEVVK